MKEWTFHDMKKVDRSKLGDQVPLELFRTIRLIGMYQGLPMGGKATTVTIGRKIGENLPANSIEELLHLIQELKIGIPEVSYQDEKRMKIKVDDCFCKGLPVQEERMVCDLEGAMIEGAISKFMKRKVSVREVMCNVCGDDYCEYEVRL